jgi:alkyldihydroxyacetonephosphate synthase
LIDPSEASLTFAGDGSFALLVLGFESSDHEVGALLDRALAICAEHGGTVAERRVSVPREGGGGGSGSGGAAGADSSAGAGEASGVGAWREAFLRAPYVRDTFVAIGVLSETFETAITWERFPALHERVLAAAHAAADGVAGAARVSCRFTHVYPDGPAPYYTVLAPARRGEEVEQWAAIKAAVSGALIAEGATITRHHAVGRDHRPWYDAQRPDVFAAALRGAKAAVDPAGVMNPGVLVDAQP